MFGFDQSVIKHRSVDLEWKGSILVLHLGHEWSNTPATFENQGLLPSHWQNISEQ